MSKGNEKPPPAAPAPKRWSTHYGSMLSKRREDQMRKTAFTEEQVAHALRQAEAGTPVAEICRKLGISEQPF